MKAWAMAMMLTGVLMGADWKEFNGRWNITFEGSTGRVWWLEVNHAETPARWGKFVGAPGGQVDKIGSLGVEGDELVWVFERKPQGALVRNTYRARVVRGSLEGSMVSASGGKENAPVKFAGKRAPVIEEADDGGWKEGRPVALFNGRDSGGWQRVVESRPGWVVKDGALVNEPRASDIRSEAKFWNFVLRAEYRYSKGSNSGIGLRGRYELQIEDSFGKAPDDHVQGALYSRVPPKENASLPAGEWQRLEARLVGRTLTVKLNGKLIHDRITVEGPTAMSTDADEAAPGPITLQGDHGPIEFRKVEVTPLERADKKGARK